MNPPQPNSSSEPSRRRFLQSTASAVGASVALRVPFVHAAGEPNNQTIKIAVIGCGGRGSGAALNALGAASTSVYPDEGYHTEDVREDATIAQNQIQVVALTDLFENRLERCRSNLQRLGMEVPKSRCFVGFDAYEKALADPDVNYVTCATPPHSRGVLQRTRDQLGRRHKLDNPAGTRPLRIWAV